MSSLVNYSSSEESDVESSESISTLEGESAKPKKKILPLPDDIKHMFNDDQNLVDDPNKHNGRLRSFPHLEGNWATLIYLPYLPEDEFFHLQEQLLTCLRPLEFNPMQDYHVSLSRTVTIRHHWIPEMKETFASEFAKQEKSGCEIIDVSIFTNDEKTRTFLALEVTTGDDILEGYVAVVDKCFDSYKLEKYYKPPSFHVSIAWCLEDKTDQITKKTRCKLKKTLNAALEEDNDLKYFLVEHICMKTGNKEFTFPLR